MYRSTFGTRQQIAFNSEAEYYELLGYLARSDGSSNLVWERNDEQGAWAPEGRIEFFVNPPGNLGAHLQYTAGRGNIVSRVNCNEFIQHIKDNHNFVLGQSQDTDSIRLTVPERYLDNFDNGRQL